MRRAAAAVGIVLLLTGCDSGAEPSPPPPSEDALTTTTEPVDDPVPTTSPPPDDVEETTAPPPLDTSESTAVDDSGPPELPDEAQEDSESGAEAFALHYIDIINYTGRYPEVGLLEPLAAEGCLSCSNHEDAVAYMVDHGESVELDGLEVGEVAPLHKPGEGLARVRVPTSQAAQPVLGNDGEIVDNVPAMDATLVLDLVWNDGWLVSEIRVDLGQR